MTAVGLESVCRFSASRERTENVRDVKTGAQAWQSPGFAPRGCVNVVLANGRVFWPSAASGMIYCWDPAP